MAGLVVLVSTVAATLVGGAWLGRRGRRLGATPVRATPVRATPVRATPTGDGPALTAAELSATLGERATLVQFSSAFCQPCRATRRVLADVAGQVAGVAHVEIDAESHLDLVRRLDIRRTPTVLVLDPAGRIMRQASGQPRPADVIGALSFIGVGEIDPVVGT